MSVCAGLWNFVLSYGGTTLFNFTKAAEEKNAENLLGLTDTPALVQAYEANMRAHTAHAYPNQRRGPTGGTTMPQPAGEESAVRGNRQRQISHLPNGPDYARLGPASAVSSASEAEAEQAGYR